MTYIFFFALGLVVLIGLFRSLSGDPREQHPASIVDDGFDDASGAAGPVRTDLVPIPGIPQEIQGMQDLMRDE